MTAHPLRPATPQDRDALIDLWVEAWAAARPSIDFEARRGWFRTRLDELDAEGAVTLVAHDPHVGVAGFVTVNRSTGYLDQLAVRPARRGTGLASALMAEAKRLCPGGLGLHVNQDNGRAVRFYQREGFVMVEASTNPRSGLPVWRMRWP